MSVDTGAWSWGFKDFEISVSEFIWWDTVSSGQVGEGQLGF